MTFIRLLGHAADALRVGPREELWDGLLRERVLVSGPLFSPILLARLDWMSRRRACGVRIWLLDPVLRHPPVKRRSADAEERGGCLPLPAGTRKRSKDTFAFVAGQVLSGADWSRMLEHLGGQIFELDRGARAVDHCVAQGVLQLANVARPVVGQHGLHCLVAHAVYGAARDGSLFGESVTDEQG